MLKFGNIKTYGLLLSTKGLSSISCYLIKIEPSFILAGLSYSLCAGVPPLLTYFELIFVVDLPHCYPPC
jgi:uncharacterized protein YybS (DUF2232 family)